MIDERMKAVRELRVEADKLRLACVVAAGNAALLHVAYDQTVEALPTLHDAVMLAQLNGAFR